MNDVRSRLDRTAITARSRLDLTAIVEFFHDLSALSDGDLTVQCVSTYRRDEKAIANHRGRVMKIVRSRTVHGEKRIAAYHVRPMEIVRLSR